ncbi:uncharacterized protein LOC100855331 [Vitis vinifera]|uniref:uncharacterized protein LOC100855331 n=1 Tax=Vitis vinifera TaxID=29760 RepID=UPI00023B2EEA|nr:uncharacterized protein LOC100855331 [Vitis vinifera]|eukprot:XP_003633398.1 PREDICTED: uncharacterized protein LOC100855331 [Vitis vinifera]
MPFVYIYKYFLLLQLLTTCMSSLLLTHQYHLIVTLSASIVGWECFLGHGLMSVLMHLGKQSFKRIRVWLTWRKWPVIDTGPGTLSNSPGCSLCDTPSKGCYKRY